MKEIREKNNKIGKSTYTNIIFLLTTLFTVSQGNLKAQTYRIMPLGNSITRGTMCTNGSIVGCTNIDDNEAISYRNTLFNLLDAAGYEFEFVGSESYGGSVMTDTDNAGFGGIRDDQLADIMEIGTSSRTGMVTPGPYLESYPADIILLHIGTNDVQVSDYTVTGVERILDAIDTYEISSGNPIIVFLARIISRKGNPCNTDAGIVAFNSNLDAMAARRIASGDKIILVDMECGAGLDYSTDLIDELHPNQTGYNKMGQAWYNSIDAYLRVPDSPSGLNFDNITSSSIRLSWTDNSDNEGGFEIRRSESLSEIYTLVHITDADITTYTDNGLEEGTEYFYRVNAVNAGGASSYISGSAMTLVTLPEAPSELNFDNITINSIQLNWVDNSNNETGFEIRRSESPSDVYNLVYITDEDVVSYVDSALEEDTEYFYRLNAVNAAGISSYISGSATTLLSLPAAPSGLSLDNITTSSIRLNWIDNSDNEEGFEIRCSQSLSGDYDLIHTTDADITTYTHNGLTEGTEYFYRVNAINAGGASSYISASSTTLLSLPAAPSELNFDHITTSSIRLNWTDNSDNEEGFVIWRSESSLGSYNLVYITEEDVVSYADNNLKEGTEYFYRVNAVNAAGVSSYISGSAKTLVALPAAPSGLNFDKITASSIRLNWTDNSDNEEGFEIKRAELFTDNYDLIHTTEANAISYTDNGLEEGKEYFYRVNSVNMAGASSYVSGSASTLVYEKDSINSNVNEIDSLFTFYPNPNDGHITLIINNNDESVKMGYLRIADFSGRVLLNSELDLSDGLPVNIFELQLPGSLKNGFYSLILITVDRSVAEKFVLMR